MGLSGMTNQKVMLWMMTFMMTINDDIFPTICLYGKTKWKTENLKSK